jgi:hypothetical protein
MKNQGRNPLLAIAFRAGNEGQQSIYAFSISQGADIPDGRREPVRDENN